MLTLVEQGNTAVDTTTVAAFASFKNIRKTECNYRRYGALDSA
jgi:hypothetical protein